MTLVRFMKARRLHFMVLLMALALGHVVLVWSGDSRAGTKDCEFGANCPSCASTNGEGYCTVPVQGLMPGTCSGTGNNCNGTGVWNCGFVVLCATDWWTGQPCGTLSVCN